MSNTLNKKEIKEYEPQICTPDEMTSEEKTRFLDARDQHLIRQNFNKTTGGKQWQQEQE